MRLRSIFLAPTALVMFLLFFVPLLIALAYSLLTRGPYGGVFPPWTIEHWLAGRTVLNLNRLEKEVWQYWPHSLRLIARELLGFAIYFLGVWPICTIQAPKDFRGYPWPGRWVGEGHGFGHRRSFQATRFMSALQRGLSLHAAGRC